jgi:hypothetical protein
LFSQLPFFVAQMAVFLPPGRTLLLPLPSAYGARVVAGPTFAISGMDGQKEYYGIIQAPSELEVLQWAELWGTEQRAWWTPYTTAVVRWNAGRGESFLYKVADRQAADILREDWAKSWRWSLVGHPSSRTAPVREENVHVRTSCRIIDVSSLSGH